MRDCCRSELTLHLVTYLEHFQEFASVLAQRPITTSTQDEEIDPEYLQGFKIAVQDSFRTIHDSFKRFKVIAQTFETQYPSLGNLQCQLYSSFKNEITVNLR